jgi:hypothetical protein
MRLAISALAIAVAVAGHAQLTNSTYLQNSYNNLGQISQLVNYGPSSTLSQFTSLNHDGAGDLLSESETVPSYTSLSGLITNTFVPTGNPTAGQLKQSVSGRSAQSYTYNYVADPASNYDIPWHGGHL